MKNANRKRNKKDAKASKKTSKGNGSGKNRKPSGRPKSPTKKKSVKNEKTHKVVTVSQFGKSKPNDKRGAKGENKKGRNKSPAKSKDTSRSKVSIPNKRKSIDRSVRGTKIHGKALTLEKTNTEILNDLKAKGRTFKSTARSLKISESNLRAYRKFYLGIKGGKKPPSDLRGKILKEAEKRKVDTKKEVKSFKGQVLNPSVISVPSDRTLKKWENDTFVNDNGKEKNYRYVHVFIDVIFNHTDGTKVPKTVGQFFQLKEGREKIQQQLTQYIETLTDYSYVESLRIINIGYFYV